MYMIDTNVFVSFLRGDLPLCLEIFQNSDPTIFKVPSAVKAELLLGAEKSSNPHKNRFEVERLLAPFEIVPFDEQAAIAYATIRASLEMQGKPIGPMDMIIAATALSRQAVLVTNNVREFKRVQGLQTESWQEADV